MEVEDIFYFGQNDSQTIEIRIENAKRGNIGLEHITVFESAELVESQLTQLESGDLLSAQRG